MNAHRIEATVTKDRTLLLDDLPFGAGQVVEVIVLATAAPNEASPDLNHAKNAASSHNVWSDASRKALQEVWDNPEDAAYDNL